MRRADTVAEMRVPAVAAIVVLAAVLGGVVALLLGKATGLGDESTVYVPVTTEAVVSPGGTATGRPLPGNRFDPAVLYARRVGGVVTLYANLGAEGQSQGSGFVVDRRGTILTNAHVITNVASGATSSGVRGAAAVYVEFRDGDRVPAKIVGWDLFNDIGVVRIDPKDHELQPVPLGDSDRVVVGTPVAAIGSPFGEQNSLAVGVVAATGRSIDSLTSGYAVSDAIQTDAPINRGNSGGPLFDARGRVIGINAQIRSASGTAEGVGFAIPINVARRALDQLDRTGKVVYAYIGITTHDVTPGLARRFGLGAKRGALIAEIEPGTPAESAGLRAGSQVESYNGLSITLGGDLIVAIGTSPVRSADDVSRIVTDQLLPGQRVIFRVLRDGDRAVTVRVTLGNRPLRPRG
jgi:S1-C subfamily serine protease